MLIALTTDVVVLLLGVSVVLLVRSCAARAERAAAAGLGAQFGHPATVRIEGRPFLTQALRGRPLRDLLGRRAGELVCERVHAQVVIPFGELARVAPIPGQELTPPGERLLASAALPVPGLNPDRARPGGSGLDRRGRGGCVPQSHSAGRASRRLSAGTRCAVAVATPGPILSPTWVARSARACR